MQRGRLVVMHGNDDGLVTGTAFPLLPLTSLGRAPTNTIHFEDSFISNVHAFITLRGGRWWLEDQGSSNGTQLNGHRVEQPVVVTTGDTISIGQVELRIELE
jgi:pSer/pThr/pTyr-binding forkhead associated (FHA) protein